MFRCSNLLSGFALVPGQDAAEGGFMYYLAFGSRCEIGCQNVVTDIFTLMGALGVIIYRPNAKDMVKVLEVDWFINRNSRQKFEV